MKYKVGDKVKIKENLIVGKTYGGLYLHDGAGRHIGEETIVTKVGRSNYWLGVDNSSRVWTEEMLEPVEEMSAEEALRLQAEMCTSNRMCSSCPIGEMKREVNLDCTIFISKYPKRVIEALKQWKADHEKKPIETEFIYIVRIIEDKQCVYEEEIVGESEDEAQERVLKKYCEDHEGKFYAVAERICRVKE